jgi:hypothetical protein
MRLSYALIMAFGCLLAGLRAAEAPLTLPAAAQAHLAAGSKVIEMATGDLNADGRADLVFVGEGTDPSKIKKRSDGYELNSNTRTIVVLLADKEGYRKVCESAKFIPPSYTLEFDNYIERFHGLKIEKGVVSVTFNWFASVGTAWTSMETFKFRLEKGRVRLIGAEEDSYSRTLGDKILTSTNYLTGKRKVTSGLEEFDDEPSHPKITWEELESKKPIYLEDLPPCGRAQ